MIWLTVVVWLVGVALVHVVVLMDLRQAVEPGPVLPPAQRPVVVTGGLPMWSDPWLCRCAKDSNVPLRDLWAARTRVARMRGAT